MELYNTITVEQAWVMSSARCGYPPVNEEVTIQCEIYQPLPEGDSLFYFVRFAAIPERLRGVVKELSRGSTCPSPDDKHDSFYRHDVSRWLRAVGVKAIFVEPNP
jgi:hypothetical protein